MIARFISICSGLAAQRCLWLFAYVLLSVAACQSPDREAIDWVIDRGAYRCTPGSSWQVQLGELRLTQVGPFRQCVWEARTLRADSLPFTTSVDVKLSDRESADGANWVGFTFGLPDGVGGGLPVGVTADGHVFIGKYDEYNEVELPDQFRLEVRSLVARDHEHYVFLEVFRSSGRMIGQWISPIEPAWLNGAVALTVSNQLPPLVVPWEAKPDKQQRLKVSPKDTGWLASFDNWLLYGERVDNH